MPKPKSESALNIERLTQVLLQDEARAALIMMSAPQLARALDAARVYAPHVIEPEPVEVRESTESLIARARKHAVQARSVGAHDTAGMVSDLVAALERATASDQQGDVDHPAPFGPVKRTRVKRSHLGVDEQGRVTVICPTCGAKGNEECGTASGRDHATRRRLIVAQDEVEKINRG